MTFDPYDPGDRRLSGRAHIASWLILAALVGVLAVVVPQIGIGDEASQLAGGQLAEEDCAV